MYALHCIVKFIQTIVERTQVLIKNKYNTDRGFLRNQKSKTLQHRIRVIDFVSRALARLAVNSTVFQRFSAVNVSYQKLYLNIFNYLETSTRGCNSLISLYLYVAKFLTTHVKLFVETFLYRNVYSKFFKQMYTYFLFHLADFITEKNYFLTNIFLGAEPNITIRQFKFFNTSKSNLDILTKGRILYFLNVPLTRMFGAFSITLATIFIIIDYFDINLLRQLGIWYVVVALAFGLFSGFNFFIKRYQYGKFTSAVQRFWKRTNAYFWLLEGFLFLIFFYYYLNSSQEPHYMFDESALNQNQLVSVLSSGFESYVVLLYLIAHLQYCQLKLPTMQQRQLWTHFLIITAGMLFILLNESYQFYYAVNKFTEYTWVFSEVDNTWSQDVDISRLRVKYQYLIFCLLLKYWHFIFIFLSWVFIVLKCWELNKVSYNLLALASQNALILFCLNLFFYFNWAKWLVRRFYDTAYYWFFTNPNEFFFESFLNEITLLVIEVRFTLSAFNIEILIFMARALAKKVCYTVNHKKLGLYYFYFSLLTGLSGAILATAIRIEMAYPGSPFFGGDSLKYLQVITAHALIMIFFVVVPIFFGGFANYLLPYHVGSKDVAYPRLNSLGFWIQPCGYLLVAKIGFLRTLCWTSYEKTAYYFNMRKNTQHIDAYSVNEAGSYPNLFQYEAPSYKDVEVDKISTNKQLSLEQATLLSNANSWKVNFWRDVYNHPDSFWFLVINSKRMKPKKRHIVKCTSATQTVSGWTFITPFSSKTKFTAIGVQDMLILGVYFVGISSTISLVNLLATRRTLSIPGLRNRRILLPFISITVLLMLRALAVITPVLGSAMLMLAFDRHWKTSFFDFAYGGDPVFFHHLFWFFGHPEVYVLVIPAFGVINSVLPNITMRRVASKHHLVWAIYIMNYMGFLVWGHHMYLIGLDHRSRALYSTITIMISMPATIKVVNWTFTLVNGALRSDIIFLAVVSFILFFLVAGFTGMWLSHVSLNISMHDTLYVVAHFHLMLSGAVIMSIFVGMYAYFNNFFQVKFSRTFGYAHIILYSGGQWGTFLPLFWVSFSGLPRRLHDFPAIYMGWQSMATAGHFVTMLGVLAFYFVLLDSKLEKKMLMLLITLIARLNKRANYYLAKLLELKANDTKPKTYVLALIWLQFFFHTYDRYWLLFISAS